MGCYCCAFVSVSKRPNFWLWCQSIPEWPPQDSNSKPRPLWLPSWYHLSQKLGRFSIDTNESKIGLLWHRYKCTTKRLAFFCNIWVLPPFVLVPKWPRVASLGFKLKTKAFVVALISYVYIFKFYYLYYNFICSYLNFIISHYTYSMALI